MVYLVRRYLALDRADRMRLARAFIWLGIVDMVLRIDRRGFFISRSLRPAPEAATHSRSRRYAENCAYWIEVAAQHHVIRARCLHRALALNYCLRRVGIPSSLRIGVRKEGAALRAHAWVELDGQLVHERPATVAAFTPLLRVSGARDSRGSLGDSEHGHD